MFLLCLLLLLAFRVTHSSKWTTIPFFISNSRYAVSGNCRMWSFWLVPAESDSTLRQDFVLPGRASHRDERSSDRKIPIESDGFYRTNLLETNVIPACLESEKFYNIRDSGLPRKSGIAGMTSLGKVIYYFE